MVIGTSRGRLIRVDLHAPDPSVAPPETLTPSRVWPEVSAVAGKPVTQLLAVVRQRMVLAVAGGDLVVFAADGDGLRERCRKPSLKVDRASVDERPNGSVFVTALCPQQVRVMRLEGASLHEVKDLFTPGKPCATVLVGEQLALAYTRPVREFNVIHIADLGKVDMPQLTPVMGTDPLVARTGPDEVVYTVEQGGSSRGSGECLGIFLTGAGEPAPRSPITWSAAPAHVLVCAPYVLGVSGRDGVVHVHWHTRPTAREQFGAPRGDDVGRLMQKLPLHAAPTAACDGSAGCMGRKDGRNLVFVSGETDVFVLLPKPLAAQATALLGAGLHEAAEELVIMECRAEALERESGASASQAVRAASSALRRGAYGGGGAAASASDFTAEPSADVDAAIAECKVLLDDPAPTAEEARRARVLTGAMPLPPAKAPAALLERAAALAGVAPEDAAAQRELGAVDAKASKRVRGPPLQGRGLPPLLRDFHMRAGCVLLLRLQFEAAMRHLCLGGMDPREVLALFPGALQRPAFSFASALLTRELISAVAEQSRSPASAAETLGDEAGAAAFRVRGGADAGPGMLGVIRGVTAAQEAFAKRADLDGEEARGRAKLALEPLALSDEWGTREMRVLRRRAAVVASRGRAGGGRRGAAAAAPEAIPEAKLMEEALSCATDFCLQRRQFPEPAWESARAREDLDTAICRGLALTGRMPELCAFLARENDVNLEDASTFCSNQGLQHALALLLRTRGARGDAIRAWQRVADRPETDYTVAKLRRRGWLEGLDPPTPGGGGRAAVPGSRAPKGKDVSEAVAAAVAGEVALAMTVETLQTTDDVALLQRCLRWLAKRSPPRALSAVCAPRHIALPHAQVVETLAQAQSEHAVGKLDDDFVFRTLDHRYLLHVVMGLGSRDQGFHTALASTLATALLKCRGEKAREGAEAGRAADHAARSAVEHGLAEAARAAGGGDGARRAAAAGLRAIEGRVAGVGTAPGEEEGTAGELRRDLLAMLSWSRLYDASAVKVLVAGTSLSEERVLLHGRAGEHESALRVCLEEMADLERAETYCVEAFDDDADLNDSGSAAAEDAALGRGAERNPFLVLFSLLLAGVPGMGSLRGEALRLMERHSRRVSLRQVLGVLPPDLPVGTVRRLLSRMVPAVESRWRIARVAQQAAELERLEANVELTQAQQHYAVMDRDTVCAVTKKRIRGERFVLRAPPSRRFASTNLSVLPVLASASSKLV